MRLKLFRRDANKSDMKMLDMFAGIGGFRMSFAKYGFECAGYIEIDKFARKSYEAIYDTKKEYTARDIREVQPEELPEAEIYTAGFPCQSFSIAGKRGGFEDTRGTLFFEIARLAKERQPKYLVLENVKGLLSHDGGKTFGTILNTLSELGYSIEWQVLNSKDFGVPQNRERVFIIGHLGGFGGRQIFPIKKENKAINEERRKIDNRHSSNRQKGLNTTEEGDCYCIDSNYHKGVSPGNINSGRRTHIKACLTPERINKRQNGRRFKNLGEPMFTLTGQDIHGIGIGIIGNTVPSGYSAGNIYNPYGLAPTVRENHGKVTQTVVEYDRENGVGKELENAKTLNKSDWRGLNRNQKQNAIIENMRIRKLTPKECWRLQGFPDWAFEKAQKVNSDTQLYRQAGNSVTIPVVETIGRRLKNVQEKNDS